MPLRVLVTGFQPFDSAPRNPSGDAARALDQRVVTLVAGARGRVGFIEGRILPVVWDTAAQDLVSHIESLHPHVVISLGMAAGTFRVEQRADDVRIPHRDNLGNLPTTPRSRATTFLSTGLPRAAVESAIRSAGGPVEASTDAGGFICDNVFFALMQTYHTSGRSLRLLRAGFIHVPNDRFVPSQISQQIVDDAILGAIVATIQDLSDAEYAQTQP